MEEEKRDGKRWKKVQMIIQYYYYNTFSYYTNQKLVLKFNIFLNKHVIIDVGS